MAADGAPALDGGRWGWDLPADVHDGRAPGVEGAAARGVRRVRDLAGQHDPLALALAARARDRHGRQQCLGVGVSGPVEQPLGRPGLHDLAEVHHGHPVGDVPDDGEVVGDEQVRQPELGLDVLEQVEAFRGGWFHSGDLVRQDEDGYFYVVDRKKDMIISGGENIYSAEVENVLAGHPKVAEVAVIGVPDPRWGETPLAVIAPRDPADPPTQAEIDAFCREHLAAYKRPRQLQIVEALPRNPSGKVVKTALRERFGAVRTAGRRQRCARSSSGAWS